MSPTLTPAELDRLADMVADRISQTIAKQPLLISKEELSERTSLSLSSIERRVKDGSLPAVRLGRRLMFDPRSVVDVLTKDQKTSKGANAQ